MISTCIFYNDNLLVELKNKEFNIYYIFVSLKQLRRVAKQFDTAADKLH